MLPRNAAFRTLTWMQYSNRFGSTMWRRSFITSEFCKECCWTCVFLICYRCSWCYVTGPNFNYDDVLPQYGKHWVEFSKELRNPNAKLLIGVPAPNGGNGVCAMEY